MTVQGMTWFALNHFLHKERERETNETEAKKKKSISVPERRVTFHPSGGRYTKTYMKVLKTFPQN